MLIILF